MSYGLKTVSNTLCVPVRMFLGFSHNNSVGVARIVRLLTESKTEY